MDEERWEVHFQFEGIHGEDSRYNTLKEIMLNAKIYGN